MVLDAQWFLGDTEERNVNNKLSQIVADLFSQPKAGEDWNIRIQRFRDEIKKIAEREEALFGKFLGILESFREIIPDEKQRYHAAIQALATTAKMSKDALVNAIGDQLAELESIQKSMAPVIPGQRNGLTGWDARAKAIQSEITQLRDKIAQLENEEKGIVTYITAKQQELEYVEKSMEQIFSAISSDMTAVKNKVLEYTAENIVAQPAVQATSETPSHPAPQLLPQEAAPVPAEGKEPAQQAIEIPEPPAPLDPNLQKPCPMCGGVMNFQQIDGLWMCYTCANEEPGKDSLPDKSQVRSSAAEPAGSPASNEYTPPRKRSLPANPTKKKACPVCRMNLLWYPDDKTWRCHSCGYERKI